MCDELREELIRDEGLRLASYKDTNGFWTIGVGHLLGTEERMRKITLPEAMALLEADVNIAKAVVAVVFPDFKPCPCGGAHKVCEDEQVRFRALVNMAFNRGQANMMNSTTITPAIRQAIKDGNWAPVGPAIAASPWAKQIGQRATRLAFMLVNGTEMP